MLKVFLLGLERKEGLPSPLPFNLVLVGLASAVIEESKAWYLETTWVLILSMCIKKGNTEKLLKWRI